MRGAIKFYRCLSFRPTRPNTFRVEQQSELFPLGPKTFLFTPLTKPLIQQRENTFSIFHETILIYNMISGSSRLNWENWRATHRKKVKECEEIAEWRHASRGRLAGKCERRREDVTASISLRSGRMKGGLVCGKCSGKCMLEGNFFH